MPVFDLYGFLKFTLRVAFVIALVAYSIAMANTVGDMILSLWQMITNSVDFLKSTLNNGSGSSMSCAYYIMNELGITQSVASFSIAAISIVVLWATTVIHMFVMKMVLYFKGLYLEATK